MLRYLLLPVTLVLAVAAPATLAAETVQSPTLVPPALQALEQKMLLIHFNTARISAVFALGELGPPAGTAELGGGANKCNSIVSTTTAIIRFSPPESMGIDKINGVATPKRISIGKRLYVYTPSAKSYDGGRPWVRSVKASTPKSPTDSALSTLSEDQPTTSTGFLKRLIEEINGALSIQEVGPATVDGQQVSEYTATLSIAKLIAGRLSQKQIDAAKKNELFKKISEATATLELFITPSGMPIRTIDVIGPRNEGIGTEQDILATGIPVAILAPPARLTIGQTRLRKLEKRRLRRLRAGESVPEPVSPLGVAMPECPSEGNGEAELPPSRKAHGVSFLHWRQSESGLWASARERKPR